MKIVALALALAACGSAPADAPRQPEPPKQPTPKQPPAQPVALPETPPASKAPESIGTATMLADGTLQLHLVARGAGGMIGDAMITYPPHHPQYAYVLEHLGGMKVGESKSVPPFPDK